MIAEVCRFYGWTMDYALNMPARNFFAMLKQSRKLTMSEMRRLCDIQAISIADKTYYEKCRGQFDDPELHAPTELVVDHSRDNAQAKAWMMSQFWGHRH